MHKESNQMTAATFYAIGLLLARQLHVVGHVGENMRRQQAAGRLAASHFARAGAPGAFDARDKPLELLVVDDGADDRVGLVRIADFQPPDACDKAIEKVVTIFRELRTGQTLDGKAKLKTPSGVLSTAEAISVLTNSMALAGNFGSGEVSPQDLASALQGSVVKDEEKDRVVWQEYLANVLKKRGAEWRPLFTACNEQNE